MKLPFDLLTENYVKPSLFLCETDKTKICELKTISMSGVFRFNSYDELTFSVGRTYIDSVTGETSVNPFYNKIEALRLVYLDGFGYFEIQEPEISGNGIQEVKEVTAYSLEYTLSQKYLEEFYVNTGENNSIEVIYGNGTKPVVFYDEGNTKLSLLHLIFEKVYGWRIKHVDTSLMAMSRQFEISRASVYDFIVQDICEKFNCFAVFETIEDVRDDVIGYVSFYAESLIYKAIGDGKTKQFTISPPYDELGTVSINSYKTTAYTYNPVTGVITFDEKPKSGDVIEITDGAQSKWETDVYVTFENLAREITINYSAEDIKTVLTVKGADNLDIREVNMGLPYIVDLSYYHTADWMGTELYEAYNKYLQKCNSVQNDYKSNSEEMLNISGKITYEKQKLSLKYVAAVNITGTTVGTYYVKGGSDDNPYFTAVKLPDEYNSKATYYTLEACHLNKDKFDKLYDAIIECYINGKIENEDDMEQLKTDFAFMNSDDSDASPVEELLSLLCGNSSINAKDDAIKSFLDILWDQLGSVPLNSLYYEPYKKIKESHEEMGWNDPNNENYRKYAIVVLILESITKDIKDRETLIARYESDYIALQKANQDIANSLLITNKENFTPQQLIRLSPFLREDEYIDDNFIETDSDTIATLMQTKQELLECGYIELSKLCEPKLSFSMDMANIYALKEFDPIVWQFQLGNLINIEIRPRTNTEPAYVKRARLLEVNINFNDFSDFSCEFGELTNIRTQSSIHADLLANALMAGKSVASNASYWNQGSDMSTSLSLLLQQGLLDSAIVIKAIDGTQGVSIDKYGIHLQKIDPSTGVIDPKEGWIVNNQILYSDDNFKTSKSVFGEYVIDGRTQWGVLAEAVMAGYIAGCTMEGGTIKIGEQPDGSYAFEVRHDGTVIMNGGSTIAGYAKEQDVNAIRNSLTITSDIQPEFANEGQLWLNTSTTPYTLMVYTNNKWEYFSQQYGHMVYTSKPDTYTAGDLWILSDGDYYPETNPVYSAGAILKADDNLNWVDATPYVTQTIANIQQYFEFNKNNGLKIGQKDDKFYVNISSTRMSFYDKSNGEDIAERERDPDEVVYISNKSAVMKKIVVEEDALFESPASFENEVNLYKPNTTTGFQWKVESNGSLSLAIVS